LQLPLVMLRLSFANSHSDASDAAQDIATAAVDVAHLHLLIVIQMLPMLLRTLQLPL